MRAGDEPKGVFFFKIDRFCFSLLNCFFNSIFHEGFLFQMSRFVSVIFNIKIMSFLFHDNDVSIDVI